MACADFLGPRETVSCSLLTMFLNIFQTEKFDEKFRIFLLNKKSFWGRLWRPTLPHPRKWLVCWGAKCRAKKRTALQLSLQSRVLLCFAKQGRNRYASFWWHRRERSLFAASDGRVSESFFAIFGQKIVSPMWVNGITLLKSFWREKNLDSIFLQYVPTSRRALLLFPQYYLRYDLHAGGPSWRKTALESRGQTVVAMQPVTRTWNVLSKSIALEIFWDCLPPYLI